MIRSIDEFPEDLLPSPKGNDAQVSKKRAFQLGGQGADPTQEEDDQLAAALQEELDRLPVTPEPEPLPPLAAAIPALGADTLEALRGAASNALEHPQVAALSKIAHERFYHQRPVCEEGARVSRNWLNLLSQRDFFLAIGYPGFIINRMLDGLFSLATIRNWVDGVEPVPGDQRKILTLEHLLDRRTQSNRSKMPTRPQIEQALAKMPRTAAVSDVIGGFEAMTSAERQAHPRSPQLDKVAPDEVGELLRVVKPGEEQDNVKARPGASLPLSKRSQGKGHPLGVDLLKPDSYCYTLSKRSSKGSPVGLARLSPHDVMNLLNKRAKLERQHGVYYSLRRSDPKLPWSADNVEFLPTSELERQRSEVGRSHWAEHNE